MEQPGQYDKIFSINKPLEVWPNITAILKKTDESLEVIRKRQTIRVERFLKKWRYLTAYLTLSRLMGKFNYNKSEFIAFDINNYTEVEILKTWNFYKNFSSLSLDGSKRIMGRDIIEIYKSASDEFDITGIEIFLKNEIKIEERK